MFQMPLDYFLDNKLYLYNKGISDITIDEWSIWKFQMNIDKINKANKKNSDSSINMDSVQDTFKQ